eukprot:TRINITY_DN140723_c0_g1_i1.p1 TRINITY_DN140723_c0_g1~~TRINITY_DN140723_c0_g1_i1.p1  ORF type:complete len:200 (-),score=14.53 TRINITY_DN140723_c0_g1_i1:876-1475(-)
MNEEHFSYLQICRFIYREKLSLRNKLRSINDDAALVRESVKRIRGNKKTPLVANLRCGVWHCSGLHDDVCYFRSTDGHPFQKSFSPSRLNLHLLELFKSHDEIIIVDSTKKGKRFSDAHSRTIPIWCAVLNRWRFSCCKENGDEKLDDIDTLPYWVPPMERCFIQERLDSFVADLKQSKGTVLFKNCKRMSQQLRQSKY